MLHLDTKNPSNSHTTTSYNSLLAFKPRQVILAQQNPTRTMTASALKEENSSKITSITPEVKGTLHQSILDYLRRNGFSKSLKRFQSEAQIQTDTCKDSLLHLEDIFCKYDACNADSTKNASKKPVLGDDEAIKKDNICTTSEEITTKKKKKKGTVDAIKDQTEITDKLMVESKDIIVDELKTKPKKKKKTKHDSDPSGQPKTGTINGLQIDNLTKKTKGSKEKSINEKESATEAAEKERKKKRKRSNSDENENLSTEVTITDESKRQKTETPKEKKSRKDNEVNAQETSNGGQKSSAQKSTKKQLNGSAEPKTVNAFQRVKIDEVEFAHEKLQDNSYWAKDGAEIGYGAKAQEVLGQVRGRDFRHEKTKKKRGSYRGGLIDLNSHSIKFNYSDEE